MTKEFLNEKFSYYTKLARTFPSYSELYLYYMGMARTYLDLYLGE